MEEYTMSELLSVINAAIKQNQTSAPTIPPPLILTGGFQKSGLSAEAIAKEIIVRQQEAGIPIGALADGSENPSEKMYLIIVQTILRHLFENARITVVIPAGIPVTATGVCPAGPVAVQGATVSYTVGTGIIQ